MTKTENAAVATIENETKIAALIADDSFDPDDFEGPVRRVIEPLDATDDDPFDSLH
jgi:hypothetical protein